MIINLYGTNYNVEPVRSAYMVNDSLAVMLIDKDNGEDFAVITVCLTNSYTPDGHAYVDTNNCPWVEKFIKDNDLGENTGIVGYSGYCQYPLYKFNLEKIPEVQ